MVPWIERPNDVANLLNPAFCGLLLRKAVDGYASESKTGLPYPLAFLVLPILLHEATRDSLPPRISTVLHAWLQKNPHIRPGFASRVETLLPYTREALIYVGLRKVLDFSEDHQSIVAGSIKVSTAKIEIDLTLEVEDCIKQASFVGRWLAVSGNTRNIYGFWGIQP